MLDSEPVLPTEESDEDFIPSIQNVPNFSKIQSSFCSQQAVFGSSSCAADQNMVMTPANLLTLSKFIPKEEYNELVTLSRTLEPEVHRSNQTMIHLLIKNNHSHLIKQYSNCMQDTITNTVAQLQTSEASQLIAEHKAGRKNLM